jgi:formyl-CoA transferase
VEANEIVYTAHHPVRGETKMIGVPLKLKETPGQPQGPSPLLGQHTEEILLGLGYTTKDIEGLEAEGVIKTSPKKMESKK